MTIPFPHRLFRSMGVGLLSTALTACSFSRPFVSGQQAINAIPDQLAVENEESEMTVQTQPWGADVFRIRPLRENPLLPAKRIDSLSVTEAGLFDVIQLLFEGTSLAVMFEGGPDNMRRYGPVTTYGLSGDLNVVMQQLGQALGFFWTYQDGMVIIEPEQQFMVNLPPILNDDNLAGITNTLQYLGARDPYLDRNERQIVFRANRKALASAESYLRRLRESRSMIVYDVQILQVDLRDGQRMGIQWNSYAKRAAEDVTLNEMSNSGTNAGIALTLVGNSFKGSALIEFLNTQGTVKSLSKPRIGVMSGTRGSLRVGQSTTIVSKIGRDLSTTVSQTTVETKEVRTGLELNLFGEEHDKTVYTRINLSITELLRLNRFTALGTELTLPDVADREMRTQIRSRPGDTIILGGITINRADLDRSVGITNNLMNSQSNQSELVIVLKPRLVIFKPGNDSLAMRAEPPVQIAPPMQITPPQMMPLPTMPLQMAPVPSQLPPGKPRHVGPTKLADGDETHRGEAGGTDFSPAAPTSYRVSDMIFKTPVSPRLLPGAL